MTIDRLGSAGRNVVQTSEADVPATASTDVSFFGSLIEQSPHQRTPNSSATSTNVLSEASGKLTTQTNRMIKSLLAFGNENKFDAARQYPGHLSAAVLSTQVLAKCVGKSVQGLDKICNLQ